MEFVTIGGETRPFWFSYKAWKVLKSITADALKKKKEIEDEQVIFLGFKFGHILEGQEVGFSIKDVEDWIDREPEKYHEIMALYQKQLSKLFGTEEGKTNKTPKLQKK